MSFRTRSRARSTLKKGINAEDTRRRRGETSFELRKATRDEQLQKRRQLRSSAPEETTDVAVTTGPLNVSQIPALKAEIMTNDKARITNGVRQFRKLLSIAERPPIRDVIAAGIVPRLVQCLKSGDHTLTFEAAWALTNIASGTQDQTRVVLESGAVPLFVQLLGSPNKDVKEQSVWALGNIAGDCDTFRDGVLKTGALRKLMQLCAPPHNSISLLRNATWVISNLCRGRPQPPFEAVKPAIACLAWLLNNCKDEEVLIDAAWALSYLTDDNTEGNIKIQAVLQHGVAPMLVKLLGHHMNKICTPVLRTVGNIVTGTDIQTQEMLNKGLLPALMPLLVNQKRTIRKEACWTISNITAGTSQQIQTCIDQSVLPPLITVLNSDEFNVKKEACWALSNITNNGKREHVMYLAKQGVIPPMCNVLSCSDPKIVLVALQCLENTLKIGQEESERSGADNVYCDIIEECGGLDHLEKLQHHDNDDVYSKSAAILSTFFAGEAAEDEAMGPKSTGTEFSFGASGGSNIDFSFEGGQQQAGFAF